MKIIKDFIPKGRKNRPGYKMKPEYITIHDTGNTSKGANAKVHSNYIKTDSCADRPASWHLTIDDSNTAYQHLPFDEIGWHAGDGGNGTGNRKSIGIEMCVNSDGNFKKTLENTIEVVKQLMRDYNIPIGNVKQHFDWSKKNCPAKLRAIPGGWKKFITALKVDSKSATEPEWVKILKVKTTSPDGWIKFVNNNKNHPTGKWLPHLIEKLSK